MSGFDPKQLNRNDQVMLGAGVVAFIASFLPYVGASWSVSAEGVSQSGSVHVNAWHSYAVLGDILLLLAFGVAVAKVAASANMPKLPVGTNIAIAGLAGVGTLLVIIRGFTVDSGIPAADLEQAKLFGIRVHESSGVSWGGYILFIAGIVMTIAAVLSARESGEKLAWDSSALNRPAAPVPGQAAAPGAYPPPPAGYQPPPATYQPPAQQPGAPDQNQPSV